MTDSHPMLQMLGLDNAPATEPPVEPSAVAPDATATASPRPDGVPFPDEEFISLDEAMAALDGQDTPPTETATPDPDSASPAAALTPEQIATIVAENASFKAEKAQLQAAHADAQYDALWDTHISNGEAFYDAVAEIVGAWGQAQGMNAREIKGLIAEVVDDGVGIEHVNKIAGGRLFVPPGQPGYLAWQRETGHNRLSETRKYLAGKNTPSKLDQMTAAYGLDEADRTTLAQLINTVDAETLDTLARTLGAKNQRVSSTLTDIQSHANRNVANNLSNGLAPGVPGVSPPAKRVQLDHTRKSTEYAAARLMRFVG